MDPAGADRELSANLHCENVTVYGPDFAMQDAAGFDIASTADFSHGCVTYVFLNVLVANYAWSWRFDIRAPVEGERFYSCTCYNAWGMVRAHCDGGTRPGQAGDAYKSLLWYLVDCDWQGLGYGLDLVNLRDVVVDKAFLIANPNKDALAIPPTSGSAAARPRRRYFQLRWLRRHRAMRVLIWLTLLGAACPVLAQTPGAFQGGGSAGNTVQIGQAITDTGTRVSICPTAACYPGIVGMLAVSSQTQVPNVSNWMISGSLYAQDRQTTVQAISDVAEYLGAAQGSGAANMWTLNTNIVRGSAPTTLGNGGSPLIPSGQVPLSSATIGYELDYGNWDQNSISSGGSVALQAGLYLHSAGYFTSQDGIYLDYNPLSGPINDNSQNFAWFNGLAMYGVKLNQHADIELLTSAGYAIHIEGTHTVGLDTVADTGIVQAVNVHSGQSICFRGEATQDCMNYDAATGYLSIRNNSGIANVVIQDSGNEVVTGSVTQAGRRDVQLSGAAATNSSGQVLVPFGNRPDGSAWFTSAPSVLATPVDIPLTEGVMVVGVSATAVALQFYTTGNGSPDAAGLNRGYTIHASGH